MTARIPTLIRLRRERDRDSNPDHTPAVPARWLFSGEQPLPLTHLDVSVVRAALAVASAHVDELRADILKHDRNGRAPSIDTLRDVAAALTHFLLTGRRASERPSIAAYRDKHVATLLGEGPKTEGDPVDESDRFWGDEADRRLATSGTGGTITRSQT
jgi:hypothetical protein